MTDDVEWLTYRELADRLGVTVDGARMKARRAKWLTTTTRANDGTVHVAVPKGAFDQPNVPRGTRKVVRHGPVRGERPRERSAELAELAELRRQVAELADDLGASARELRRELTEERAARERERVEARAERERLLALIEGLATPARPVERPGLVERIAGWLARKPSEGR